MVSVNKNEIKKRSEKRIAHALAKELGVTDLNVTSDRYALELRDHENKKEHALKLLKTIQFPEIQKGVRDDQ